MESSDSYTSSSSISYPQQYEENKVARTSSSSFYPSLHDIRRNPMKPMKKHIAPLPPTKPKVYKVDSINFKQVVQRLTAAPEFQPNMGRGSSEVIDVVETVAPGFRQRRLEEVAPPALDLSGNGGQDDQGEQQFRNFLDGMSSQIPASPFSEFITSERKLSKMPETCGSQSPLAFSFSPSSMAWCFSPLLSPGTLSILE